MGIDMVGVVTLILVFLAWLVFGAIFLLRKKPLKTEETKRVAAAKWGIALQAVGFALVGSFHRTQWWPLPRSRFGEVILAAVAVVLAYSSCWFCLIAVRALGKQWTYEARVIQGHELITQGPYALVRNPIYLGMFGLMIATGLYYHFGVAGGNGGKHFDDSDDFPYPDPHSRRLLSIRVRSGKFIDSIQLVYLGNNGSDWPEPHHGGQGGNESEFSLADGEHLVKIEGSFGNNIDYLELTTDSGQKQAFGEVHALPSSGFERIVPNVLLPDATNAFRYQAPPGFEIFAVWGNAGDLLDAIGVVIRRTGPFVESLELTKRV